MKACTGVQSQVKRTPNLTDWGLLVAELQREVSMPRSLSLVISLEVMMGLWRHYDALCPVLI